VAVRARVRRPVDAMDIRGLRNRPSNSGSVVGPRWRVFFRAAVLGQQGGTTRRCRPGPVQWHIESVAIGPGRSQVDTQKERSEPHLFSPKASSVILVRSRFYSAFRLVVSASRLFVGDGNKSDMQWASGWPGRR